jgi:hypothetical protein
MRKLWMKYDYYDIPITLNVVISVKAESEEQAAEKLYMMEDSDIVELLVEQVHFIGGEFDSMTSH